MKNSSNLIQIRGEKVLVMVFALLICLNAGAADQNSQQAKKGPRKPISAEKRAEFKASAQACFSKFGFTPSQGVAPSSEVKQCLKDAGVPPRKPQGKPPRK